MKNYIIKTWQLSCLIMAFTACEDDLSRSSSPQENRIPITLSGEVEQISVTRVNDNGFCNGDVMGVYVVDYQGDNPGTLLNKGNRGDNVAHTFDEAAYRWNSAFDIYWKDKHTPIDVYAYYPFNTTPENVNAYAFEVQKDQSKPAEGGALATYEASDFLWGKASHIAPTETKIRVPLKHRLSSVKVMLEEGQGFAAGEWAQLEKSVLIKNVKREALINLADGLAVATGKVSPIGTIPYRKDNAYRAIVVPQTVSASTVLFSLTVGTTPYTFKKQEAFVYTAGKMHNFTIKVDKKTTTGEFTFTLMGESITAWENDDISHDATMKEYIVIHSEAGKLKEAIVAAKRDFRKLQNLKITGEINANDFFFMRDSMYMLQSINLKEVKIKRSTYNQYGEQIAEEDEIPMCAFKDKKSLINLVLPDKLRIIREEAFALCDNLSGSLIIPEGVTKIYMGAFQKCRALTGKLVLPSTLEILGAPGYTLAPTFGDCGFTSELKLPQNLKYIGFQCFINCKSLYGELHLPNSLTTMLDYAFYGCGNLTGSLTIPQHITQIPYSAFESCGFNGTLTLHDGITSISGNAFYGCHFKGELVLPKELQILRENAFTYCDFSGELKLPNKLIVIGDKAFAYNWRLTGTLEFPEGLQAIGAGAFAKCRNIEGLVFPQSLENIRSEVSWLEDGGAFQDCFGIQSIVCKSSMPAYVQNGAFHGVPKDNFTLEVPQPAIQQYQATPGWSDFKRIAAHRELVCRPSIASAINTECTRRLVLNAESDWEVASMPHWCSLSQTSGTKKTELTLTIHQMAPGTAPRTGEIVFRLKDKQYTHKCTVTQYDYTYAENEILTLQKATKGNRGGINLVFLGDGFDAKDISEGKYMTAMQEQVEHFFAIEPYKTYRDYFNVYTGIAVSPESGIGTINTIRYAKFETTFTGGVGLRCDYDAAFRYALQMPTVTQDNLKESLIIMTPNTTDYAGICQMWDDGSAIAFCPMSTYGYPLDTRGVLQHEAGGHGFGKLGDEYIYHNEFIDFCSCTCCPHVFEFEQAKAKGWYDNLSLTGKMHEVPWSHFIFDSRYSDFVDIFEGGFMHNRGVFRSELNSCMNNNIPYFNTISRESIVKRIKRYAGEPYSFEEFVANDKRDAAVVTRFNQQPFTGTSRTGFHQSPVIHKGSPLSH